MDEKYCNKAHMVLAMSQARFQEVRGKQDNPEILKYFDLLGFDGAALHDETAWCSAFVGWVAKTAGLPFSEKLTARSWLKIGTEVKEGDQEIGDVVIFWRVDKNSWQGHVGFYIREDKNNIFVWGGNQGNQVKPSAYPKSKLLGYRRLT